MNADDSDHELSEADRLLAKADALLSRYRKTPNEETGDDDDLPLVTEIVDYPSTPKPLPPQTEEEEASRVERFIELDTTISRAVEEWVATELPALIERELAGMSERLRVETVGHLRATLIPRLSEEVSRRLLGEDESGR